jgi:hypothetical protein
LLLTASAGSLSGGFSFPGAEACGQRAYTRAPATVSSFAWKAPASGSQVAFQASFDGRGPVIARACG